MDHYCLPEDEPYFSAEEEARRDEESAYGDPRVCPRHPRIAMSSPDGMFDGWDCDRCLSEEADAIEAHEAYQASGSTLDFEAWDEADKFGARVALLWLWREALQAEAQSPIAVDDSCPF